MRQVRMLDFSAAHHEQAEALEAAAARVMRRGHYIRGPEVEAFEHEFARYCGAGGAVGVGNGFDALQLTLTAMGIGSGDEVIVSAHTSIATWLAVTHAGARPVPVEPRSETMLLDVERAADALTPRTAAIIPVHMYGGAVDMDAVVQLARSRGLAVLEDASQAHGARWSGRRVGSLGDAGAFSLYPTKNLGAIGDAGIVVSDDRSLLDRLRMLANYGERERHRSELIGRNSRLDELQAALLRVKLQQLDGDNSRRRERATQYLRTLGGLAPIRLPGTSREVEPVWHQFVIRAEDRDALRRELAHRGVETLVHYPIAPHRAPAYAEAYPDPLPLTEQVAGTVISLPISPQLGEADCAYVCDAVRDAVRALG